ncbi:protein kinase domain-containing protein [Zavarzinella formosa]|uniref:protein kinase domain-containing protein n=1 Tax=Zavarzinella formosa TaxID=360055 RepID=UPI0002D73806|nr:protein kinase [Zavarzinella formosa]
MNQANSCPTIDEYEAAFDGSEDESRLAALEEHLAHCKTCQQKLESRPTDPNLINALQSRAVSEPSEKPDPALGGMLARLEDMASQFTPAGFDLSFSADGLADPETATRSSYEPADLQQMGVYRVVRLLGAGGMGLVYLAEDEVLRRQVAVKVLRPRLARKTRAREGFLREARAMASLKHDNVVTVFQVGETTGPGGETIPFLAMELLEGESLADWIRREGPLPAGWIPGIGRQAAGGLAAAHACGVVHRDIKPGNLWLEAPSWWTDMPKADRPPLPTVARIKVLDFGLAQPTGEESIDDNRTILGTPAYMPPEQAAGKEVNHRADLFSLGVVLYELTTGRRPYPREKQTDIPAYATPPRVTDLARNVPPVLADLIHRLISPNPADRPETAREVQQALIPLTNTGMDETIPIHAETRRPAPVRKQRRLPASVLMGLLSLAAVILMVRNLPRSPEPAKSNITAAEALIPDGPPDDAWVRAVSKLPLEKQPAVVIAKLQELNPDFDGQVNRISYQNGTVTDFSILTDEVSDIRPIRVFTELKSLQVVGSEPGKGKLADLTPIRSMKLTTLNIWQNPDLADVSPARGMSLTLFQAGDTAVKDISPLQGMPIGTLAVNNCRVEDLAPVRSMPQLRLLRCDGCPISSLKPVLNSTIRSLLFTRRPERGDDELLKQLTKLEQINGLSANDFRKMHLTTP